MSEATATARTRLPPGPRAPVLGQTVAWALRTAWFLERCQRRYGDAFTVRLGRGHVVVLADPADVHGVFTGDGSLQRAGSSRRLMEPLFGAGSILLVDGEAHARQRRLLGSALREERAASRAEAMRRIVDDHVERWPVGRAFALRTRIRDLTVDLNLRFVFGLDGERVERMRAAVTRVLRLAETSTGEIFGQLRPLRSRPARLLWAPFTRAMARVDALLVEEIARRRRDPDSGGGGDVLTALVRDGHPDGTPATDRELRNALMAIFLAGHETSMSAHTWTLHELVRHPEALERVRGEPDGPAPYAHAVLRESLRLHPPVQTVGRELARTAPIGEWVLPAGTIVAPCAYLLQRRPELYPEPTAFRPERFLDGAPPAPDSWIPFGGGHRRCLGAGYASEQAVAVLRRVVARLRLRAADPDPEPPRRRGVVLVPGRGGRVVVEERHARA